MLACIHNLHARAMHQLRSTLTAERPLGCGHAALHSGQLQQVWEGVSQQWEVTKEVWFVFRV